MDNINFNQATGKHSFYARGEKAWHLKGQYSDGYKRSQEVLIESGLDFTVAQAGNTHIIPGDGPTYYSDNSFFTYRTDTNEVLGDKIGRKYHIVQNRDAFTFFDAIVDGEGILYETAGALGKGEKIFITAKLPDYIEVAQKDLLEKYIFLYNSHDGCGSIKVAFTPIRIVCNNTLNAALRDCSNSIEIRHTESAKEKLAKAHLFMGICNKFSQQFEAMMQSWSKVRITDRQVLRLIEIAMAPSPETLRLLRDGRTDDLSGKFKNAVLDTYTYAMGNPTQNMESTGGTLFGAYNAMTGYYQNVKKFKDWETKFVSIMEGTAQRKGQRAFDLCANFQQVGEDALILN